MEPRHVLQLAAQRESAEESVVGVHRYRHTRSADRLDWMFGERVDETGVNVRGGADLQDDASGDESFGDGTGTGRVARDVEVVNDPDPVPDPGGPQVEGSGDGLDPGGFPGMNGDTETGVTSMSNRSAMEIRRESDLRTGQIEAHRAAVRPATGRLGHRQRVGLVPQRRADESDFDAEIVGVAQASEDGLDGVVHRHSLRSVGFWCKANLGVDDPIVGEVLDAVSGHPLEGMGGLHHRQRVPEHFQVANQARYLRLSLQGSGQLARIGGGQTSIAGEVGEVDQGLGTQATIEVVMEEDAVDGLPRDQSGDLFLEAGHDGSHAAQAQWGHYLFQTHVEIEVVVDVKDGRRRFPVEPGRQDPGVATHRW